jgi:hypothetical protein
MKNTNGYYLANRNTIIERSQRRYRNNPQKHYELTRKRLIERLQNQPLIQSLYNAKSRAKKNGIPFNIKYKDLPPHPTHCPILNIPLIYRGKRCAGSASIDRIIPMFGYVKGNIAIISNRANTLKNNATIQEIKLLLTWMEKQ